jgi:molybdate transport system permease protein
MTDPALWLTIQLAALTTGVLVALALPIAYGLAFLRWRFKPLLEAVVALPLVLPPTVLGFYLLLAMGAQGPLGRVWEQAFHRPLAFTFPALVIGSVCYSLPFAVQPLQAAFQSINPRLLEASWTLGASRFTTFFRVILPNSLPGLAAAVVLSFAHTLGEFGVVLMVGGNIPGQTRTVSIAIYDLVESLEYGAAGQLALVLLLFSYSVLVGFYLLHQKVFQPWRQA